MNKSIPMTPEEREACVRLYRKMGQAIDREEQDVVLNLLCFLIGEVGTGVNMPKEHFLEQVMRQVSSAYDMFDLANMKPQGEA